MTPWGYYWLVVKRAAKHSYVLARHVPFWVAIVLGILSIGQYVVPSHLPLPYHVPPALSWWLTKVVEFPWTSRQRS